MLATVLDDFILMLKCLARCLTLVGMFVGMTMFIPSLLYALASITNIQLTGIVGGLFGISIAISGFAAAEVFYTNAKKLKHFITYGG